MTREFIESVASTGRVNLNGAPMDLYILEVILEVLKRRPDITIEGCGEGTSLIDLIIQGAAAYGKSTS